MYKFSKKLDWLKRRLKKYRNIFEAKNQLERELKAVKARIQEEGRSQVLYQIKRPHQKFRGSPS